jgi:hypothetical protein
MKDLAARYRRLSGATLTRERAAKLVAAFNEQPRRRFTAKELAALSGFPYPACSMALAALRAGRLIVRQYDSELKHQMWRRFSSGEAEPEASFEAELDGRVYIPEAAELTGRSEKLIRSRMDRGTLAAYVEKRRRYTTRRALIAAGLLEGGKARTRTDRGMFNLVEWLSLRPGEYFATSYLAKQSGLKRQGCETALAALEAAALTHRDHDVTYQNAVWTWIGPPAPNARPAGEARPRPSPRPLRRPHIEQEGH